MYSIIILTEKTLSSHHTDICTIFITQHSWIIEYQETLFICAMNNHFVGSEFDYRGNKC